MQQQSAIASAFGRWLWLATAGAATACFIILSTRPVQAQTRDDAAPRLKTESPYFFVKSDDPSADALPLKSTDVTVQITGVIADVTVTQVYRNEGQRSIEARYVFPGSTRAAVHGMTVRLADRVITADIREKQRARIEYDAAKREGKTAALLEQHLPNVFQMNVANILPGDEVRVELRYTELLVPQSGQYQFVFPTVVGPRYNSPQSQLNAGGKADWVAQPYLPEGRQSSAAFDLRVFMSTPIGIKEVASPSHDVRVSREGNGEGDRAAVTLKTTGWNENNRDFILDYRLAGDTVESGLLLHRGQGGGPEGSPLGENFFLAMIEPPKAVPSSVITPRDYIFVVDISGSMHGFPLDTAKAMLAELIGGLKPSDTFNVMLFAGSSRMLSPQSVPATRANINQALRTIDQYQGSGSTELMPALRRVYDEPRHADLSRTVVVVTDGYVTVESEAFALVRRNLSKANVFAFGIGSAVNRHLMEGLARAGMGEPFIITNASQAPAEAARFRRMIESPVLTSVKARFEGLDVYDVEPLQLPDVLGERPVIVFGKWRGEPRGQLVIEGRSAEGAHRQVLPVPTASTPGIAAAKDTQALRYLWARHRIATLSDQEALDGRGAQREEITALGLRYGLLTQYTSFLAVDRVVRNPAPHDAAGVDQPSPLPQGVGNLAVGSSSAPVVGAEVPGTPEPAAWGAMLVTLSVLAMVARRSRRRKAAAFTA
ncbi:VIT and vWA domain-containing protein [Variovorax sp. VNK109]|uniref:VIT and vWA domain-containing protein n=1 Tax=Variovorax sp. VNK109 TaxID=3400919 RepID=UPI003C071A01